MIPLNPVERFNLELLARQYERNVAILSGANAADAAPRARPSDRANCVVSPLRASPDFRKEEGK